MALRDDIRLAYGAILSAVPDAAHLMRHGENESANVIQSSSREFADPISADTPAEAARFIANASDFPTLDNGSAVDLDGSFRLVVALKADPVAATLSLSLSAPFDHSPATYSGRRRINDVARTISFPLDVLHVENGPADNFSDASAPSYDTSYTLAIRREDWPDETPPEVADVVEIAPNGYALPLKVSTVSRHDGFFILKCRTRSL